MPQIILFVETAADKIYTSENIACYIVADTLPDEKTAAVQAVGKMVLSMGNRALEVCRDRKLDGVVKEIDPSKPVKVQLKSLREALKNKTLGVIVPARRHEAMLAGEVEPEFIAFRPTAETASAEVLGWYNDLFLIPSAWIADESLCKETAPTADFVIVSAKNFENFGC